MSHSTHCLCSDPLCQPVASNSMQGTHPKSVRKGRGQDKAKGGGTQDVTASEASAGLWSRPRTEGCQLLYPCGSRSLVGWRAHMVLGGLFHRGWVEVGAEQNSLLSVSRSAQLSLCLELDSPCWCGCLGLPGVKLDPDPPSSAAVPQAGLPALLVLKRPH